ncbi:hypothetical protein C4G66_RS24725 [Vibrio parahaemolyticus]|nr:hypothetical protein [Vibrio parahaemolyticus]EJG1072132.1 hypothetical protein [Vibrio parahaemolyticus]
MKLLNLEEIYILCSKGSEDPNFSVFKERSGYYLRDLYSHKLEGLKYIESLREKGIVSDYDIYNLAQGKINDFIDYSNNSLLDIIGRYDNDGTLYVSDDEHIHYMCFDAYIDFIKKIVEVGGKLDVDKFLAKVFAGEKQEYLLFDYIINNFQVSYRSLHEAAAWLLYNSYYLEDCGRKALELILSKNINFNDRFDKYFDLYEFDSLLGVMFFAHPILFMEALENRPDDKIIDNFPWDFILSESEINQDHISAILKLKRMGYSIPLNQIAEQIESEGEVDLATQLKG